MNHTILIIEDNKDMRENTAEILEMANYKVITSDNGKSGIELARNNKPDLILCDIMMPEIDGYNVLRAIENIPEMIGTPFVFISAKSEKKDIRTGMDLGADDYLTKPFSGNDLLKVVASRINKSNILKKNFTKTIDGLNDFIREVKSLYELGSLSEQRTHKRFKKKDTIYMENDMPGYLFFVISGKIKSYKTNYWGKEFITDIYKEGDFFGYTSLLDNIGQHETTEALEDAEVALISRNDFIKLLYSNNDVSLAFIKLLTNNLSSSGEKLLKLAYDSARKKTSEALLLVCKKYQSEGKTEIAFPICRENLSSIAGLSPESVSRNLTEFREEGLIETVSGNVIIKDLKKLENLKW